MTTSTASVLDYACEVSEAKKGEEDWKSKWDQAAGDRDDSDTDCAGTDTILP